MHIAHPTVQRYTQPEYLPAIRIARLAAMVGRSGRLDLFLTQLLGFEKFTAESEALKEHRSSGGVDGVHCCDTSASGRQAWSCGVAMRMSALKPRNVGKSG